MRMCVILQLQEVLVRIVVILLAMFDRRRASDA